MAAARHHLIGRDDELARISRALGSGGSVLLRGDPGIGKTALLLAHATPPTAVTVTGAGDLPLSAFAHLGDVEWRQPTPTAIAAALYRTTVRLGTSLVIVDDAHWLDPASAGLVLQLARSGTPVLAAARTGTPIPRAIQAVIRQSGEIIEVGDLSIESVRALMEQQLDAPVSLAFATAVAGRTRGNPLYVREVVSAVVSAEAATLRRGIWVVTGSIPLLDVGDLLSERVEQLGGRVRFALELIAIAGELPLHELLDAVGEATTSAAESEGVIRVRDGLARPGHPLLRDAALSGLPAGRRSRVHETLLRVTGVQTPAAAAQRALWRLEGGFDIGADELIGAAELVFSSSVGLSGRLATAAAERLSRPDQSVRLAALWVNLGDAAKADQVLETAARPLPPDLERAAIALRGFAGWILHDRPDEALAVIERGMRTHGSSPMLLAQRASVLWRLGRMSEARAVGEAVAADGSAPLDARGVAAATLHSIAAQELDARGVEARATAVAAILASSDRPLGEGRATFQITVAGRRILFEEDLDWAESHLRGAFTDALERGEEHEAAQYGWMLGWSLVLRGRPQDAISTMPEFLEPGGPWAIVNRGWATPCYIRALVAAGHVPAARTELDRARITPPSPMVAAEVGAAEVDVLAAEGHRARALERARHHRRIAVANGSEFTAVSLAWTELLLGGQAAARELVTMTSRSEVRLHHTQAGFARAVLAADVDAAVGAATDLMALGHRWHALEAVSVAASLPGRTEPQRIGLRDLHAALTEGLPPVLTRAQPLRFSGLAVLLTGREVEVAALAAQGLSDRAIAERLVLSVRTIETHMAHVFAKSGLHRREDLSSLL